MNVSSFDLVTTWRKLNNYITVYYGPLSSMLFRVLVIGYWLICPQSERLLRPLPSTLILARGSCHSRFSLADAEYVY